jgi:hypothetical protein
MLKRRFQPFWHAWALLPPFDHASGEGADGHCQVNNLRLAHMVIFDWLDRLFAHESGDVRLRV